MINQLIQFIQSLNEWGIMLVMLIAVVVIVFVGGFIQVYLEMRDWQTWADNDFQQPKKKIKN